MFDIDTARLRELALAATPGSWFVDSYKHYAERMPRYRIMYTATDAHNLGAKFPLATLELYGSGRGSDEANAEFVAAANPRVVLELLSQLAAVTKARDELADALQSLAQITSQHGDYTQDPDYLLAARLRATGTTEGEGER